MGCCSRKQAVGCNHGRYDSDVFMEWDEGCFTVYCLLSTCLLNRELLVHGWFEVMRLWYATYDVGIWMIISMFIACTKNERGHVQQMMDMDDGLWLEAEVKVRLKVQDLSGEEGVQRGSLVPSRSLKWGFFFSWFLVTKFF